MTTNYLEADDDYNKKTTYLINNNISQKYTIEYAIFPISTMSYLVDLSKLINPKYAFNILMNIPQQTKLKLNTININSNNIDTVVKLLKYNFVWGTILIKKNIDIKLVMTLLNEYKDFYYFELCCINDTVNDFKVSFNKMIKNRNNTLKYKENFYKLKSAGITHNYAYSWCKNNDIVINNILELIKYDYNIVPMLVVAHLLNEEQMDFLRFSRLGYSTVEEFNKYRNNIFDNALSKIFMFW
jgi:hypothetical protein